MGIAVGIGLSGGKGGKLVGIIVIIGSTNIGWTGHKLEPELHPEAVLVVAGDGLGAQLVS